MILVNDPTALVTGATSGIGLEIARSLARRGYNLVLVGRREKLLLEIQKDLEKKHDINVFTIPVDLSASKASETLLQHLKVKNISIDMIVNNAGFGIWGTFDEIDQEREKALLQVQIINFLQLTRLVIPMMRKKGKGIILNVGSVYSYSPVPNQAVYAASKAFVASFSTALSQELKGSGITVTLLCPGLTLTEFRKALGKQEKKNWMSMLAHDVAEIGVEGALRGKKVITPGWVNKLYVFISKHLPVQAITPFIQWLLKSVRKFDI